MNKRQAQRLLDVATACRESKFPDQFTMGQFGHSCNTPACALGQYAVRGDLQRMSYLARHGQLLFSNKSWVWDDVRTWFGITEDEEDELFGGRGCNNAQTPNQAAKYIENFLYERGWEVAA